MRYSLSNLAKGKGLSMHVPNGHGIPRYFHHPGSPRSRCPVNCEMFKELAKRTSASFLETDVIPLK